METVYQKYRPSHEVLIEYYAYEDLRRILRLEWEHEDELYRNHSDVCGKSMKLHTQTKNVGRKIQNLLGLRGNSSR